jgi:hypothetical protein
MAGDTGAAVAGEVGGVNAASYSSLLARGEATSVQTTARQTYRDISRNSRRCRHHGSRVFLRDLASSDALTLQPLFADEAVPLLGNALQDVPREHCTPSLTTNLVPQYIQLNPRFSIRASCFEQVPDGRFHKIKAAPIVQAHKC